jgi:hypothetical protein
MEDGDTRGGKTALEQVQDELRSIHDEIQRQLERAATVSRALVENRSTDEYLLRLEMMEPERLVADNLREIDDTATLGEYLGLLHRLAEMSSHELQSEWRRHQSRHLSDLSNRAARGLHEMGNLVIQARDHDNFSSLAALFRGVHQASEGYAFLAQRLEAFEQAQTGLPPRT